MISISEKAETSSKSNNISLTSMPLEILYKISEFIAMVDEGNLPRVQAAIKAFTYNDYNYAGQIEGFCDRYRYELEKLGVTYSEEG